MTRFRSVALVNCCLPRRQDEPRGAPQGALYVATALAAKGIPSTLHDTAIDLTPSAFTPEALGEYLLAIPAQIIGISVWDSVLTKVVLATRILKNKDPQRFVVLGGPAASSLSDPIIRKFPWIDCAIEGEGELTLVNLLNWLHSGRTERATLSNRITVRHAGEVLRGRSETPAIQAREIHSPDYSLIEQHRYSRLEIVSTRGCPFDCPFCSVNRTGGHLLKKRPLDHLFCEISGLLDRGCSDCIHVLDDNFGTDRDRLDAFCRRFAIAHSSARWSCYFRMADLDPSTVDQLADASCDGVYVGVESGSDKVLEELHRGLTARSVLDRIAYASQRLNVTASFIWGLPGEDMSDLRHTLDLVAEVLDFERVYVNLYQLSPLSGTALYRRLAPEMEFHPQAVSGFIYPPFLAELTSDEIDLIDSDPHIFSAFYHEGGAAFWQKLNTVREFLGAEQQTEQKGGDYEDRP